MLSNLFRVWYLFKEALPVQKEVTVSFRQRKYNWFSMFPMQLFWAGEQWPAGWDQVPLQVSWQDEDRGVPLPPGRWAVAQDCCVPQCLPPAAPRGLQQVSKHVLSSGLLWKIISSSGNKIGKEIWFPPTPRPINISFKKHAKLPWDKKRKTKY